MKTESINRTETITHVLQIFTMILAAPIILGVFVYGVTTLVVYITPTTSDFILTTGIRIGMIFIGLASISTPIGILGLLLDEFGWVKPKEGFSLFCEKTGGILMGITFVLMLIGLISMNL